VLSLDPLVFLLLEQFLTGPVFQGGFLFNLNEVEGGGKQIVLLIRSQKAELLTDLGDLFLPLSLPLFELLGQLLEFLPQVLQKLLIGLQGLPGVLKILFLLDLGLFLVSLLATLLIGLVGTGLDFLGFLFFQVLEVLGVGLLLLLLVFEVVLHVVLHLVDHTEDLTGLGLVGLLLNQGKQFLLRVLGLKFGGLFKLDKSFLLLSLVVVLGQNLNLGFQGGDLLNQILFLLDELFLFFFPQLGLFLELFGILLDLPVQVFNFLGQFGLFAGVELNGAGQILDLLVALLNRLHLFLVVVLGPALVFLEGLLVFFLLLGELGLHLLQDVNNLVDGPVNLLSLLLKLDALKRLLSSDYPDHLR